MPYVKRDVGGHVVSLHLEKESGALEFLPNDHPEIRTFIGLESKSHILEQMDQDFIRVIEDVIDLLLARNIIIFTDLPAPVQEKLTKRRQVRDEGSHSVLDDDVILLP